MASKVAAAALQFSKWLSRTITWFWMIFRMIVVILSAVQPSAASALVTTITGVDTIMMVNVGTYLINSLGEKYIYSDRFVLSWLKEGGWKSFINRVANVKEEEKEDSNG